MFLLVTTEDADRNRFTFEYEVATAPRAIARAAVACFPRTDPSVMSVIGPASYLGTAAQMDEGAGMAKLYLHGDLIGSTNVASDAWGQALAFGGGSGGGSGGTPAVVYTAFGEIVGSGGPANPRSPTIPAAPPAGFPRYQYAGAWGYESGLLELSGPNDDLPAITLQHVGARWYQPGIGRFVLRDPIGISGGINCYRYVADNPISQVDPNGLWHWDHEPGWKFKVVDDQTPTIDEDDLAQVVWDEAHGTVDGVVDWATASWVSDIGGHTFDPTRRANAKWRSQVISGTASCVYGGVKAAAAKAASNRSLKNASTTLGVTGCCHASDGVLAENRASNPAAGSKSVFAKSFLATW